MSLSFIQPDKLNRDFFFVRTETGMLTLIMTPKEPKDWKYMMLNPLYQYYFKTIDSEGSAREMIVLVRFNMNFDGMRTN